MDPDQKNRKFLGLLDPDPSISKQKETLISTVLWLLKWSMT
jgi:hypothetical protein